MRFAPQKRRELQLLDPVRAVLDALTALVSHDVSLQIELFLVDERTEIAHAIGLEPKEKRERRRRGDIEVVGAVFGGPSVVAPPRCLHDSLPGLVRRCQLL